MKTGKLPPELLARMLARAPSGGDEVLIGPRIGEDAAAVAFGDRVLVCAMDPITFAADLIGWYAVHINANDIAVMGAVPRWFLAAVLAPESADESDVEHIFDQLGEACRALDVALIGGHTEIAPDIAQPIAVGCMLGEALPGGPISSSGANPGDAIILCGPAAVEGTAILARDAAEDLRAAGIDDEAIMHARDFPFDPGISVVALARAAVEAGGVTAMHDPTEGGIATGLRELALASEAGLEVAADRIPSLPVTEQICRALELNPLGLIASGALLLTARPDAADALVRALLCVARHVRVIGRVLGKDEGLWMLAGEQRRPLPDFPRDEVARYLEEHAG